MDLDDALRMGEIILRELQLNDWQLGYDNARRRAGKCDYRRRRITLSRELTQQFTVAQVRDVVLHEAAHALVGPEAKHGATWKAMARKIGATPKYAINAPVKASETRWVGICPSGHRVGRHRAPLRAASCAKCCSSFDPSALLQWYHDGVLVQISEMPARYQQEWARLQHMN